MPLVAELFLDPATDAAIRAIWTELSATGVCDHHENSGSRPHLSLSVFDDVFESEVQAVIERTARHQAPFEIQFAAQGRFPGTHVAFLTPKPTPGLLALQASVHAALVDLGATVWPNYQPANWFPHCTLAMQARHDRAELLGHIVDAHLPLPPARVEHIGLVNFPPVEQRFSAPLRGRS